MGISQMKANVRSQNQKVHRCSLHATAGLSVVAEAVLLKHPCLNTTCIRML